MMEDVQSPGTDTMQDELQMEQGTAEMPEYALEEEGGNEEPNYDDEADEEELPDVPSSEEEEIELTDPEKEVRRKYVGAGNIVSSFKNADERKRAQDMANAEDYIAHMRNVCSEKERTKLSAADNVAQIVAQSSEIGRSIAAAEEKQGAGKISALEERQLGQLRRELAQQHEARAEAEKVLYTATHEMALAEAELHKYDQMAEAIAQDKEVQAEESYVLSSIMAEKASEMQDRAWRRQQKAEKEMLARHDAAQKREAKAQHMAQEGKRGAKQRLEKATEDGAAVRKAAEEQREEGHTKRATAVLELKKSTEDAQARIKAQNVRQAKKEAKMALIDEKRRLEVVAAGGNPYAVKGLREQAEQHTKKLEENASTRKQRHGAIADRLIQEQEYIAKKEEEERELEAYEERFRKELGRGMKEKRVADYLKSRTKGGRDIIDPTSRMPRIDASQETVIMTAQFGLSGAQDPYSGTSTHLQAADDGVIAKVMRDIKNDPMQSSVEVDDGSMHTITRRFKDPEEMQPDPLHVTVKTRVPPPEKPEPVVRPISPDNLPEQPHAVPEIEGLWKVEKKKREINAGELSKFEQRMMDEAHERHKTQLTKDQHV